MKKLLVAMLLTACGPTFVTNGGVEINDPFGVVDPTVANEAEAILLRYVKSHGYDPTLTDACLKTATVEVIAPDDPRADDASVPGYARGTNIFFTPELTQGSHLYPKYCLYVYFHELMHAINYCHFGVEPDPKKHHSGPEWEFILGYLDYRCRDLFPNQKIKPEYVL